MVRESRFGLCCRHVYHHRPKGKQLVFFLLLLFPLLTDIPFIVTPRDRRGELLQAGVPYLERHPVKKRRRTAAHLPPPILYFGSAQRLV